MSCYQSLSPALTPRWKYHHHPPPLGGGCETTDLRPETKSERKAPVDEQEEMVLSVAEELVRNGSRSGRGRPWKDRTHCLYAHPYTAENIIWRKHGAR
jgi:hypothetical protein